MFVRITDPNHYWYGKTDVGQLVEVMAPGNNTYRLMVSEHNDKLFTRLDNVPYKNGSAPGSWDYRGCWIAKDHCDEHVEPKNNNEALALLLEEE